MDEVAELHSLTGLQRATRETIQRLVGSGRPGMLTIDGKAEVVVQDADAYQELLDRLDRAEAIVGINRGLMSMRRGEGKPAVETLDELRNELGVSR